MLVEIEEEELSIFLMAYTRWVIRNKNYTTSKWVKLFKKYYLRLNKETKKLLRNEIRGRAKQLSQSNFNIDKEHYYQSYIDLLNWIKEIENANSPQNQNGSK